MPRTTIDRLIINSPYEEPQRHRRYDRETQAFDLVAGRRPAGCVVASVDSRNIDDSVIFVGIPLVNRIRPRVKTWHEAGYRGVAVIMKRLLAHRRDPEALDARHFFFCRLEAVSLLLTLLRWKNSTQESPTRAWYCPAMRSSKWKFKIPETNEWVRGGADET